MLAAIKVWIDRHKLLSPGDKVLVACSGGPDSLALLHILNRLRDRYEIEIKVAHVNHMFRPEAVQEAEFVKKTASQWGLICETAEIDVPQYIKDTGTSSQEAARILRYRFLHQVADDWGNGKIATGHHRDDQVETVLYHLLRGSGGSGLGGMQAKNGRVIRPLLATSRRMVEEYCEAEGLQPVYDSSNLSSKYTRNRIRLDLLPQLERQYNESLRDCLWRTSQIIGDEHALIAELATKEWIHLAKEEKTRIVLDTDKLAALPVALQRQIFRQAFEKKQGHVRGIQFIHVETLIEAALCGSPNHKVELPGGLYAEKGYGVITLSGRGESDCSKPELPKDTELPVPGCVRWGDYVIAAEVSDSSSCSSSPAEAVFDYDGLTMPLVIRKRRDGDRFQPLGLGGSKKLKDFFIDAKVPRRLRDQVPIVCDRQGILWVAGWRRSEQGKIKTDTRRFIKMKLIKWEDYHA